MAKKQTDTQTVYELWLEVTDRRPTTHRLTPGRKAKIDARLREYPLDDVLDAVRGIGASAFHRGDNDRGKRYDDLTLALRNGENVERFRDEWRAPPAPALDTRTAAGRVDAQVARLSDMRRRRA